MEIFELKDLPERAYALAGGKAKGLNLLSRAGLNIGRGFVIIGIASEEDINRAAHYYIGSGLDKVAVRSSATGEDGADFSSAGQYKTFLDVDGVIDFKEALRKCIASLKDREAEAYTANFGAAKSDSMSVVVQGMVDAVKAGVCFTVNPIGDRSEILLEAVEGLGENLVSGQVNSVQYLIPRAKITGGRDISEDDLSGERLLAASEVNELTQGAMHAEKFFGMPLDTEWAIGGDGVLVWLQARAITTLEETDIHEFDTKRDISKDVMTTCNIGEMLPGAATPLAITSTIKCVDTAMRGMLEASGAYKKRGKNRELAEGDCIMSFYNTQFLNMSYVYKMAYSILGADKGSIELSLCGRLLDFEIEEKKVAKIVRLKNMFSYFSYLLGTKKAKKRMDKLILRLNKNGNPSEKKTDDLNEQYKIVSSLIPALDEAFAYHFRMSAHSGAMSSALVQIVNSKINDFDKAKSMTAPLLMDIDGIESVDILRSMRALVRAALKDNPDIKDYDNAKLAEYFKNADGEVKEKLHAFLNRHGHRAIREIEVRSKSWHNDEDGLMENLRTVISTGGVEQEKNSRAKENIDEFLSGYKGILKKVLKYIINQARQGVVNREYTKSMSIKVADYIKSSYIYIAEGLVSRGILPDADLIYFFTHEEVSRLIDGDRALVKKALARRRVFAEQESLEFDDVFVGVPKPKDGCANIDSAGIIKGMPISKGVVTGTARVVKSVEDAAKLKKGEIMVAAFTDIGWSPFYCIVGGLITERGSAVSHGAVVAREYALPLVSSVSNATQLIKTGDTLKLDANSGQITIIAS